MLFNPLNILVIEDSISDFMLLEACLFRTRIATHRVLHAETLQQGIECLATEHMDLVLLDLSLPDSRAENSYHQIKLSRNDVPVIIFTSLEDEDLALSIVKDGAQDYLLKSELTPRMLEKTILYSIERKKNMAELEQSQIQYQLLFDNNPMPMWIYDIETLRFVMVNNAALIHYGYTRKEFLEMNTLQIRPEEERERALQYTQTPQVYAYNTAGVWRHIKKNGQIIQVEITSHFIEMGGKQYKLVVAYDVTEKIKAKAGLEKSERIFRSLAESFPNGMITLLNSDLIVEYTNGMEYKKLGIDPLTNTGVEIFSQPIYADQKQPILTALKKCLDGETIKFEVTWLDKIYSCLAAPILPGDGLEKKIIVITEDITEKRRVEKHLHLLESVVVNSSNGVMIITKPKHEDEQPQIIFANKAQADITGYTIDEILGKSPVMFMSKKASNIISDRVNTAIRKDRAIDADLVNYKKDGTTCWVHKSIIPVFNDDGVCTHFVSLTSDITERKRAEQKIKETNASLKERNRKIIEIARINSHVIRRPVASILGLISLLAANKANNGEISEIINHLEVCALELDGVIHTIAQKAI